ncbi:MAG TPA: protein kinase [Steroidobacteraceae bacterium]|nr:protein kinase [Steroidobacteraceae bacterium]
MFLTRSGARGPADVAIKLVPTNRALAELLLPRWRRAGNLAHPNLLPLLQWGGCQLEGLPYLYALMEYADQTLAELLTHRALTDDETREMLPPILDALAYLHRQELVQGQLKPTNILVVGDQIKLATDTARRLSEGATSTHSPTAYDPPEARQGSTSPAGDIWALGVTLCEALTRRLPSGLNEPGEAPVLPADFSPVFRDIVTRCLSLNPHDRPGLKELAAFARGQSTESASGATYELPALARTEPLTGEPTAAEAKAAERAESVPAELMTAEAATIEAEARDPGTETGTIEAVIPEPTTSETVTIEAIEPEASTAESVTSEALTPEPLAAEPLGAGPVTAEPVAAELRPTAFTPLRVASDDGWTAAPEEQKDAEEGEPTQRPAALGAILGVLVIIGVVWAGVRMLSGHSAPAPPLPVVQAPVAPAAEAAAAPVSAGSISRDAASEAAQQVHEFIPDVPAGARRSVRGHIKVWVRVIVNRDGSVFAATPDRTGSSRYFERVALEAAKKWTFPPVDAPSQRLVQIRFDFSRQGVTARAVTLR